MKKILAFTVMFLISGLSFAEVGVGKWTTIDDKTGKQKSVVQLYKKGDKLFGKIVHIYPDKDKAPTTHCTACKDDRKGKPVMGLELVRDLTWNGTAWEGGTIVDPENGKIYVLKIWANPQDASKLNVRGYIGPFFRTQTWVKG